MIHLMIDGDWILYAAGFAGQRTRCVYAPDEGTVIFGDNQTEIIKELGGKDAFSAAHLYKRDVLDPEAHFYHSAKKMIESQVEKVQQKYNDDVTLTVLTEGDGNFRSRLATIRPYKGTRSAHSKPLMFNNLRNYLLDVWECQVVFDRETDDELAIRQTQYAAKKEKSIICAIDKDMLQVPGHHLNPNKGFKVVSKQEGLERLYVQAAMGDSVDNIAGAYKVGPAAAKKAFMGCDMSEEAMWNHLVGMYANSIEKHGDMYRGLTAEQAALENMRLVYLQREDGELWLPPSQR